MQYFTIQARTHREAIDRMKLQYGEQSKILTYRNIRIGGLFGFFGKEGVEITGYISNEEQPKATLEERKIKVLETAKKEQTLNYILRELKELKQGNGTAPNGNETGNHESISKIREMMKNNDFSSELIQEISERIKNDFSLFELEQFERVENTVAHWIAEKIKIVKNTVSEKKPRVIIVVGPTGVGKTTTIAKLAAFYGVENNGKKPLSVKIVTIDNYRIGAKKQIEIYGEIMQIPVAAAETQGDLKKLFALYQDADLILVDTIGKSQRDYTKLAEMKEILQGAFPEPEIHLAISATTKTKDLEEIFQQFESFGYTRVIVTKLDETSQIGNIISVLAKKNKPISYITDGQKVPQDIEEAGVVRLMRQLEGIRYNRALFEQRYSDSSKVSVG
ncbi:MAG: flagellar biosynthesis protein FlhF [Spirochaetales bacterium]|nr:flagellar biosynthesis protein FlhF [Spirochaetales bacterium]